MKLSLVWQNDAACRGVDPALFFPGSASSAARVSDNSYKEARAICKQCPVRPECLDYALKNNEQWGMWGGLSLKERRRVASRGKQGRCTFCGRFISKTTYRCPEECYVPG